MSGNLLATRRSVLSPLSSEHESELHDLWTSAGVRRYLWDDEIIAPDRTREAIAKNQCMFAERGFGLWGAWMNDASSMTGFAGVWPFRDPPELELVYGIAEPLWGRGHATEIAEAVIGHWFEALQMPVIRASTDAANGASIRVLQKLQFAVTHQDVVNGLDTLFYERRR